MDDEDIDWDDMEVLKKDEQVIIFQNADKDKILKILKEYDATILTNGDTSIKLQAEWKFRVASPKQIDTIGELVKKKKWNVEDFIKLDSGHRLLIYKEE